MLSDHDLDEHLLASDSKRKYLKALDYQLDLLEKLSEDSPSGRLNREWHANMFDSMVRSAKRRDAARMLGKASGPDDHDANGTGYVLALIDVLDVARTYYIDANMIGFIADVAESMPDDVQAHMEDAPSLQGFVYLETPIRTVDRWGKEFLVSGLLWSCGEKGFGISEFILNRDDAEMQENREIAKAKGVPFYPPDMGLYHIDSVIYGRDLISTDTYREEWDKRNFERLQEEAAARNVDFETARQFAVQEFESLLSVLWMRRFLVAAWAVMHGKIARPTRASKSKTQEKRLKRKGVEWGDIRIVELRASVSQPGDNRPHVGRKVQWSHRWLVRGFWRWQWYASEPGPCPHCGKEDGVHRRKYIEPYIKGPEDLPYVAKDAIYVVDR